MSGDFDGFSVSEYGLMKMIQAVNIAGNWCIKGCLGIFHLLCCEVLRDRILDISPSDGFCL